MEDKQDPGFDTLEPLPEFSSQATPEEPVLAELPDEAEMHEELPAEALDSAARGSERRQRMPSAPQGKRELDAAPLELRKASLVLMVGSVFPWGDPANLAVGPIVEKLICFLAVWIFYQTHVLKYGGKASGLVAALGKSNLKIPMILAGVIALIGMAPVVSAGSAGGFQMFAAVTEKAFLLLAGYTFVHIYDYEHGGKFNPMFPLLFLFPAIGGAVSIFGKVIPRFDDIPGKAAAAMLGAVVVCLGGLIASHTMYVAMKEAKMHGEAKKAAAQEARKAARAKRQGRSGPKGPGDDKR